MADLDAPARATFHAMTEGSAVDWQIAADGDAGRTRNRDDEHVFCALVHDVGDTLGPANHAAITAARQTVLKVRTFGML